MTQLPNVSPLTAGMRNIGDITATRQAVFNNVRTAMQRFEPLTNQRYALHLTDVDYEGADKFSKADEKRALITGQTLGRRLRGTWQLRSPDGIVVDQNRLTLASVPYLSSRGTFIINGNDYSMAHQNRLRPGIFTRQKESGELESHVNVAKGYGHRYFFDPETSVFRVQFGQSRVPLLPLLRTLGVSDSQLRKQWGNEIYAANMRAHDPGAVKKIYQKLQRSKPVPTDSNDMTAGIKQAFAEMVIDPEVSQRTLGQAFDRVTPDTIMAATDKLLRVQRGEAEVDDRDAMAYQRVLGPEDIFAERVGKARAAANKLLWKATFAGNLKKAPIGVFAKAIRGALLDTGLGNLLEEINPSETLDQMYRATRMGEGGIGSLNAVPMDSRDVQPSHLGFVDLVQTPESAKLGVDTRMTINTRKGEDGRIYATFLNPRTDKVEWKSPQELVDSVVAFPGELESDKKHVRAIVGSKLKYVPRDTVDYQLTQMTETFGPLANMVPMKAAAFPQRVAMGSRMITQALPLIDSESPLVQAAIPGEDRSFEELYGERMGAVRSDAAGIVTDIQPDFIKIKGTDGKVRTVDLFNNLPFNRKTHAHNTPTVRIGQQVSAGDLLAKSNYTDADGATALGRNIRVAYIPYKGMAYEDAIVASESFAKKMTSEHLYQHDLEKLDGTAASKNTFISVFPAKYAKKLIDNFDDDGVIKPGTKVNFDEPLVLAVRQRKTGPRLGRRKRSYVDASVTWDHHSPGVVTDVHKGKQSINVTVKSTQQSQVGDKFCYDEKTDVLTSAGWKRVAELTVNDAICSLCDGVIKYQYPTDLHSYARGGDMYRLKSRYVDLFVTASHSMYVKQRGDAEFALVPAADIVGKSVRYKKNGKWLGKSPKMAVLLPAAAFNSDGEQWLPEQGIPIRVFMLLLGCFLADGRIIEKSAGAIYGIEIAKIAQPHRRRLLRALRKCGIKYEKTHTTLRIYSRCLMLYMQTLGSEANRHMPRDIFELGADDLTVLFRWLTRSAVDNRVVVSYRAISKQLADDMQQLCLHIGKAADICSTPCSVDGQRVYWPRYTVNIINKKFTPRINAADDYRDMQVNYAVAGYTGPVFCVTVPGHIIYVRRNGKAVWSGNSGRYGDKNILAAIIPDEDMPQDAQGRPFELLLNPLGVISRGNPAQIMEAALGKVAARTGKAIKVPDFQNSGKLRDWVEQQLVQAGIEDKEKIFDPVANRYMPGIMTGNRFIMKLHHMAESKLQGRATGEYSAEGTPSKGGEDAAKRVGMLGLNALLSHGAYNVAQDVNVVRGQQNEDYWRQLMSGYTPPDPKVPFVYTKFINELQAAGINPVRKGAKINVMAMTDKDVSKLAAGRELKNADTVSWKSPQLTPTHGGLFDKRLTGGHGGQRWSQITLHTPLPNPVMEEPIRRLLGLSEKKFRDVLAGREEYRGQRGPQAISSALEAINVDRAITQARTEIKGGRKTYRDAAIRRLGYLKAAKKLDIHPKNWMLSKVPVLPPVFRPVSLLAGSNTPLVADPNYLYKELFDANDALRSLAGTVDDVSEEQLNLYDAFKAVTGLGDPIQPALKQQKVRGILKHITGMSPKHGTLQRKLLGSTVDLVGRTVITPNPELDMDQVGLPEDKAWTVYKPFIIRRLVQRGMPRVRALDAFMNREKIAKTELLNEMKVRPVIIDRAPVLHRYGVMAFWPQLTRSSTLQIPPLVTGGFGADFDGDSCIGSTLCYLQLPQRLVTTEVVTATDNADAGDTVTLTKPIAVSCANAVADTCVVTCKIEDFPRIESTRVVRDSGITVYDVPADVKVMSYDAETGATGFYPVTHFSVHPDLCGYEVSTSRGRTVSVSEDHSLYVYDGKKHCMVRQTPKDAVGKVMPAVRKISRRRIINKVAVIADVLYAVGDDADANNVIKQVKPTFDFGYWLGSCAVDAWPDWPARGSTDYAQQDAVLAKKFRHGCDVMFGDLCKNAAFYCAPFARLFYKWFLVIDANGASQRKLPEFFVQLPEACLFGILSALLDSAGSLCDAVAKNRSRFFGQLMIKSARLRDDVVLLGQLLGVRITPAQAMRRVRGRPYREYVLTLHNCDALRIQGKIKLENADKYRDWLNMPALAKGMYDGVPLPYALSFELARMLKSKNNSQEAAVHGARYGQLVSRSVAKKWIKLLDSAGSKHPQLESWRQIVFNENIVWDRVKRITSITQQTMYDITVPDTKVFAVNNGLVIYDTMNFHVPATQAAVDEAVDKMLPSRNLLSAASFGVHYLPTQEYVAGLWAASSHRDVKKPVRKFRTKEDAIRAYRRGEIGVGQRVEVLEH